MGTWLGPSWIWKEDQNQTNPKKVMQNIRIQLMNNWSEARHILPFISDTMLIYFLFSEPHVAHDPSSRSL